MSSLADLDLIALAFGAFNLMRLASYFPQIVAVARDQHGATAISFSCWTIWVGANASTALYAWVKLTDASLATVSAFNAVSCLVVLLLAAYRRTLATLCVGDPPILGGSGPSTFTNPKALVEGRASRGAECR